MEKKTTKKSASHKIGEEVTNAMKYQSGGIVDSTNTVPKNKLAVGKVGSPDWRKDALKVQKIVAIGNYEAAKKRISRNPYKEQKETEAYIAKEKEKYSAPSQFNQKKVSKGSVVKKK